MSKCRSWRPAVPSVRVGWWRHWDNSKFMFGLGPATRIYAALGATDVYEVLK
jgi:hypothetical protein